MKLLKITAGIFLTLAASRFIPHPPNFTSLIALSFYVPAIFGLRYVPVVIFSFVLTDMIIGFHQTLLFTWGSVLLIGYLSTLSLFKGNFFLRIIGLFSGSLIFFLLTNIGVWFTGVYGYTINSLLNCYILAIPFFTNTVLATLFFALIIETINAIFNLDQNYILLQNKNEKS